MWEIQLDVTNPANHVWASPPQQYSKLPQLVPIQDHKYTTRSIKVSRHHKITNIQCTINKTYNQHVSYKINFALPTPWCSLKCLVSTDALRGLAPAYRPPGCGMRQVPSPLVTDTTTSSPKTEMQNQKEEEHQCKAYEKEKYKWEEWQQWKTRMRTMKRNKRVKNTNNEKTNTEKKTVNASDEKKSNESEKWRV